MPGPPLANLRVLLVGNDQLLLWTRELILRRAGCVVRSASVGELSASDIDHDIVLLCTSIAAGTAEDLARAVKAAQPAIRIVRLSPWKSPPDAYFDAVCDTPLDPIDLLAELAQLRNMALGTPSLKKPDSQPH